MSAAGPLTHVPMAAFWIVCTVFAEHRRSGEWGLHLKWKYINPEYDFLHAVCLAGIWVRRLHLDLDACPASARDSMTVADCNMLTVADDTTSR